MPTKVSEYMTAKVISVKEDMGIREAFFLMRDEEIRHLPVLDDKGGLIGIVSDRELRRPNWVDESPDIAHIYDLKDDLEISDVMSRDIHFVHTYDTLSKAVKLLLKENVGAVPVLDKTENLVGMLSAVDMMRALNDLLEEQKKKK
jgi:acetoin utilization protein AcuB